MKFIACTIIFSVFFYSTATAQFFFQLQGKIINEDSIPVSGVIITVKNDSTASANCYNISNLNGIYKLNCTVAKDSFLLEFNLLGYQKLSYSINTKIFRQKDFEVIILKKNYSTLQELEVKTKIPIQIKGDTTIYNVDYFKQGNERNLEDLLNNLPGFSIENGKIKYNNQTVSKVLVEGDDLHGNNYASLIQQLSINGIEKVELINNYSDKTYLKNTLTTGSEQAVNLRFKKNKLSKIFGGSNVGYNNNANFRDISATIVSLIPKKKFVTTGNHNTLGLINNEILNRKLLIASVGLQNDDQSIDFDLKTNNSLSYISSISEIQSPIINSKDFSFNNSTSVSNNLLFRPSKKIFVKSNFQFFNDQYSQSSYSIDKILIPIIFTREASNSYLNNQQYANFSNEVVYSNFQNSQLLIKSLVVNEKNNFTQLSNIEGIPNNYHLTNYKTNIKNQLNWIHKRNKQLIELKVLHNFIKIQENTNNNPAFIWQMFLNDTTLSNLNTSKQNSSNQFAFEAKFTSRRKENLLWFTTMKVEANNYNLFTNSFGNNAVTTKKIDTLSYKLQQTFFTTFYDINCRRNYKDKLFITISSRLEYVNILRNNETEYKKENANILRLLPSFSLHFIKNSREKISGTIDQKNYVPTFLDLIVNPTINNAQSAINGTSIILFGKSTNAVINYSYINPLKNRLFVNIGISYSNTQKLLTEYNPQVFFTYTKLNSQLKQIHYLTIHSNISKYFPKIKSSLNLQLMLTKSQSYFLSNINLYKRKLSVIHYNYSLKTKFSTYFTTKLSIQGKLNNQHIIYDLTETKVNSNQNYFQATHAELNFILMKKMSITPKIILNQLFQQKKYNSFLNGSLEIQYNILKEKLSFNVDVVNVFNNQTLKQYTFNQNGFSENSILLLPRFIIARINYQF